MEFEVRYLLVQPVAYLPYVGSRFFFFFFHIQGNDYFNNKVDYTFGHDNDEDGLNLSFSNFLRGALPTYRVLS